MTKILFFDTETTGKANFNAPPDAEYQPRIVQLGALLCDEKECEIASINLIIRPVFEIPVEASNVHGITTEFAKSCGVPVFYALQLFWALVRQADLLVAHNIAFDSFIIKGESLRFVTDTLEKPEVCTMKAMTPRCKIPGRYEDYKWPKLSEAYRHAFGKDLDGAHDAMSDIRATKDVYFWITKQSS